MKNVESALNLLANEGLRELLWNTLLKSGDIETLAQARGKHEMRSGTPLLTSQHFVIIKFSYIHF